MINQKEITDIFLDCLFKQDEIVNDKPTIDPIYATGIVIDKFGFNPERIKLYNEDIKKAVDQLHETFDKGWSFLNIGLLKDGTIWTTSHQCMEQLLVLGIATGFLKYTLPKKSWRILPGGVPYVIKIL